MPVECPYCDAQIPDPDGRATLGDARADHVNEEHADLVRAVYTGEIDRASFWLLAEARREVTATDGDA